VRHRLITDLLQWGEYQNNPTIKVDIIEEFNPISH